MQVAVLCLAALAGLLHGQPAVGDSSVTGRVINSYNDAPVARFRVVLRALEGPPLSPEEVLTDSQGVFRWVGVPAGKYQLVARRDREGSTPKALVVLAPGERIQDLVVRVLPGGALNGRVVDDQGEPADGAEIGLLRVGSVTGVRKTIDTGVAPVRADDRGVFRIPRLKPGRYVVWAKWHSSTFRAGEPQWVTTFHPTGRSTTDATPVVVAPGSESDIGELRLLRAVAHPLRGTLTREGVPLSRVTVQFYSEETQSGAAAVAEKGHFEIQGLAPGRYGVIVRSLRGDERFDATLVMPEQPVGDARIDFPGPAMIAGRIILAGRPEAKLEGLRINVSSQSAKVAADGSFTLGGFPPSAYDVYVDGLPGNAAIRSVKLDGVPMSGTVRFEATPPRKMEIEVDPDGGSIHARIVDGEKPAPWAVVVLLRPNGEVMVDRTDKAQTDFGRLAPGRYRLYAFDEMSHGSWNDIDALRKFDSRSVVVDLAPNGQPTVEVKRIVNRGEL